MLKNLPVFILILMPFSVLAVNKPSMTSMWLELLFLIVVLIVIKIASLSNQQKLLMFVTYVLSGIISQTIWLPVLIFIIMFVLFKQKVDDDSWN